jgi:hypothetical protein
VGNECSRKWADGQDCTFARRSPIMILQGGFFIYIYIYLTFPFSYLEKICSIYGLIRPLIVSIKLIYSPQLVIIKRFTRVLVALPVASILS